MAKQDLIAELKKLGVKADPELSASELKQLLKQAKADSAKEEDKGEDEGGPKILKEEEEEEKGEEEPRIEAPEAKLPEESSESYPLQEFEDKQPLTGKALRMKKLLEAEPKVRFYISLANGEKMGVTQSVNINGYPMYIRKGQYVDLPESVCDILEEKMKQKMRVANHPYKMGGDGSVKLDTFGGN